MSSVDRRNRIRFVIWGLVLIALGVLGLLLRGGVLALQTPSDIFEDAQDQAVRYPEAAIAIFLAVALLLCIWGLVLVLRQVRSDRGSKLHTLTVQSRSDGQTTLPATAAAKALAQDLERDPAVHDAAVRLVEAGEVPHVQVRATVDPEADLTDVRERMEDAFGRFRHMYGADRMDADLDVRLSESSRRGRVS